MTSLSWQQLFTKLTSLVSRSDSISIYKYKHTITSLLDRYTSREDDFKKYLFFHESGYTKNLVADFGDQCNVIVMCWAPGQSSAFHGHEGSKCLVKVLSGELIEQQVPYPAEEPDKYWLEPSEKLLRRDDVSYIDDSIGLHKVMNRSIEEPAVTLHIYMPAYTRVRVFEDEINEKNGKTISVSINRSKALDVTFHSEIGIPQ